MKKLLTTVVVLMAGLMSAQDFTVTNGENGAITQGEVFSFNTTGPNANIHIQINNQSSGDLFFKLKGISVQNATTAQVNFCFGEICMNTFNPGQYVPPTAYPNITIAPGTANSVDDKFFNKDAGDGETYPIIYEITLYQYASAEQDQTTGTPVLTFFYEYTPSASTPNMTLQKLGVAVQNTVVYNDFSFNATTDLSVELFDLNGRSVSSENFRQGSNVYNANGLTTGVYIARFTDKEGKSAAVKIVKK
ncbi:MAG TPA: T9SS type A sorting domain-containing protein [Flavobacterium sp.]|nr:T9SS type A sorting domain-containing protein [Flavobacterium sp.]